ncbi:MAG TPA: exodeoxyribonuclease VII large subunit [Saprospiraceae bacterium]|nr:exodeoxyribonuclease VII large subunit [Saprospiraceae bacterium]
MANPSAYSLLELNQYIRRVISLNFDEPVWIECEIGQASLSRGHWYLDLIQKEDNVIAAQCQAAMWANVYAYLKRKSPIPPEEILKQGMAVKLKVNVDYHERYGLKLIIEDIDSSFTIGVLEMQRQAILKTIKERNLVRKNAETHLPSVVQRLAIISSDRAAGWKDFVRHLEDNQYGYDISISLFEAAMQGQQVESEILDCLGKIEKKKDHFDAVAIIRGGGGRTDLAAFDNLLLAIRIAEFPIPVLIGIGHEIDQSVLDLVAFRSLKTPTAVADFVIEHNAAFESRLDEVWTMINEEAMDRVRQEQQKLIDLTHHLRHGIKSRVSLENNKLNHLKHMLHQNSRNLIQVNTKRIEFISALLIAIDPDRVLSRGYTITTSAGKSVTTSASLQRGETIETIFHDGRIKSIVE